MELYLMSGPSGAGKTRYAKQFAERFNLLYFGIDDFYRVYNGDETLHEDECEVWLAFFHALRLAECKGRSIIVDTNSPTRIKRCEFLDWFPAYNSHLIFLSAPPDLCWANNNSRVRKIPKDDFQEIYDSVEHPLAHEDPRWKSIMCYWNGSNDKLISYTPRDYPPKWLYRLESIRPDNGLWYDQSNKFVWGIGKIPDCTTKNLPMDYDPRYHKDGKNWFSSCSKREDLLHWYSLENAQELIQNGFVFTRYLALDYVEYDLETTFLKDTALCREEMDILELFKETEETKS